MKKDDLKKLIGISDKHINVINIKDEIIKEVNYKVVEIKSTKKSYKCPNCGKYTKSVHDKLKPSHIKGMDINGCRSMILVHKRRFICHHCSKKFTEDLNINMYKRKISNNQLIMIRKLLLNPTLNFKTIAELCNVSITEIINEMEEIISNIPDHLNSLPEVISFDEFSANTEYGKYAFVINAPISKKTLDILPSRRKEYLLNYFTKVNGRENVKYVICDMYVPYLQVQRIMFPNAKFVVDKFHYTRYIMDALDKVRRRLQEEYGYNSKEYRMLKNKNNVSLLRKYYFDLDIYSYTKRKKNNKYIEIMIADLIKELIDINEDLKTAYYLKEFFLGIVNKADINNVEENFKAWISLCRDSGIEEFIEASNTIENWLPYIVNSFIDTRYNNGFTEGRNNKIKVLKRISYGYKKFKLLRGRILYVFNGNLDGTMPKKHFFKKNKN